MRWPLPASLIVLIAGGCAAPRTNPSFSITTSDARREWRNMCDAPVSAPRTLIVIGGYGDPGVVSYDLAARFRRVLGPQAVVVPVQLGLAMSMDGARDAILRSVEKAASGGGEPEVDVVAVSMGGLVARYAAVPRDDGLRLHIARLFTISSPHLGARLADMPTLESRVRDMRRGSEFIATLDRQSREYELVPYARLGDKVVGEENTAPPGLVPWWVSTPVLEASHLQAHTDPRILADIARRLRGEAPFTHEPPAPLPSGT